MLMLATISKCEMCVCVYFLLNSCRSYILLVRNCLTLLWLGEQCVLFATYMTIVAPSYIYAFWFSTIRLSQKRHIFYITRTAWWKCICLDDFIEHTKMPIKINTTTREHINMIDVREPTNNSLIIYMVVAIICAVNPEIESQILF